MNLPNPGGHDLADFAKESAAGGLVGVTIVGGILGMGLGGSPLTG